MKKIFLLIFSIFILLGFTACSEDIENKEFTITQKFIIHNPSSPALVTTINDEYPLKLKGPYEVTSKTKASAVSFDARCQDKEALMIGEIYVNGKLRAREEGYGYIVVSVRLKPSTY